MTQLPPNPIQIHPPFEMYPGRRNFQRRLPNRRTPNRVAAIAAEHTPPTTQSLSLSEKLQQQQWDDPSGWDDVHEGYDGSSAFGLQYYDSNMVQRVLNWMHHVHQECALNGGFCPIIYPEDPPDDTWSDGGCDDDDIGDRVSINGADDDEDAQSQPQPQPQNQMQMPGSYPRGPRPIYQSQYNPRPRPQQYQNGPRRMENNHPPRALQGRNGPMPQYPLPPRPDVPFQGSSTPRRSRGQKRRAGQRQPKQAPKIVVNEDGDPCIDAATEADGY